MKLNDYIEHYENELERLREHQNELLEWDKDTRYTDKKIDFIDNLLVILRNSKRTEILREESTAYKRLAFIIEHHLREIEKSENKEQEINSFLERLREEVMEEEQC